MHGLARWYCNRQLKNLKNYKRHIKSCENQFELPVSKLPKKSQIELSNESVHKSELTWQCNICKEKLQLLSNEPNLVDFNLVAKHCNVHAKSGTVVCFHCAESFSNKQMFWNHVNRHRKMKKFKIDKVQENILETIESDENFENYSDSEEIQTNSVDSVQIDEVVDTLPLQACEPQSTVHKMSVADMNSDIKRSEAIFCLKMKSKHLLSREALDDLFEFQQKIHSKKVDLLIHQLKEKAEECNELDKVIDTLRLTDSVIGLQQRLSTEYRRDDCLKTFFDFITPMLHDIKEIGKQPSFYYSLPIKKTLARLLRDNSLREFIIKEPVFSNPEVRF